MAVFALVLSGCSLISQGTHQDVLIDTNPQGADFKVQDQQGVTPRTVSLSKAESTITFTRKGYYPKTYVLKCRASSYFYWSLAMGILAGGVDWITGAWREFESTAIKIPLVPLPGQPEERTVEVRSDPAGAEVWLGTKSLGRTSAKNPLKLNLIWEDKEQEKQLTFKLAGYYDKPVQLLKNQELLSAPPLEPMPVPINVELRSEPPGARVIVDGEQLGNPTNHIFTFNWFADTRPRKAEFFLDGYKPALKTFTRDDQTVTVVLQIEETTLPLKVETVPAGADIEVEETFAGIAPKEISLAWSVARTYYKIRISRPGYESREEIVTKDKLKQPLKVRLKPLLPRLP